MNTQKLKELGNEWEKNGKRRVYFNTAEILTFYGLSCRYYNSGNIAGATLDGEEISNSRAREIESKLAGLAIWYDMETQTWGQRGFDNLQKSYAKIIAAIEAAAA